MDTHYPDTCIHQSAGLCPECQRDADEDPSAWTDYGNHPEGLRRFAELQADREAERPTGPAASGDDIPY